MFPSVCHDVHVSRGGTNQVKSQLDLLRCGHELRPAGVHGLLQVAAIGTAVWTSALSLATERASPGTHVVRGLLLCLERWYLDTDGLQTHHIWQFLVTLKRCRVTNIRVQAF